MKIKKKVEIGTLGTVILLLRNNTGKSKDDVRHDDSHNIIRIPKQAYGAYGNPETSKSTEIEKLPKLTKAPTETDENFLNRRRMAAGLSHGPYVDPWPIDGGDYWIYPAWKVKKAETEILKEEI